MNFCRRLVSLAALAAMCMLSCNGCKSGSQQAGTPQTQYATGQNNPPSEYPRRPATVVGFAAGRASHSPRAAQPAPPPPAAVDLPASTSLHVRLDRDLGSKISQPGDTFSATVSDDVMRRRPNCHCQAARVRMVLSSTPRRSAASRAEPFSKSSSTACTQPGATILLKPASIDRAESGKGKRSAGFIGGGAGLGAIIGGMAGGGKGAAIGALAGGGAGTAGAGLTDNKQIVLPAETAPHLQPRTFRSHHPDQVKSLPTQFLASQVSNPEALDARPQRHLMKNAALCTLALALLRRRLRANSP